MGSLNSYPVSEIEPEQKQEKDVGQGINSAEKPVISRLINSLYYFIDCVFIAKSNDEYRLVALQHSRVLYDKYYPTLRGCRIAFDKMFRYKAWGKQVKAEWSHFYDPDTRWLGEKMSHAKSL